MKYTRKESLKAGWVVHLATLLNGGLSEPTRFRLRVQRKVRRNPATHVNPG